MTAQGCSSQILRAQLFHQSAELWKTGGDHRGVVDGDGAFADKAERQEGHGDAMIEVGCDGATTGNAPAWTAGDGEGFAIDANFMLERIDLRAEHGDECLYHDQHHRYDE